MVNRVNKLIRFAKVEAAKPIVLRPLREPCVLAWSDGSWATRVDGTSQGGYLVALGDGQILQNRTGKLDIVAWHSGKQRRISRSSSACETQAAGDAQEEAEYVRLVLFEILHGSVDLKDWTDQVAIVPAALIIDCRGVFDALQSESSGLGMKDRRSALEALALRRAMRSTSTTLRWCHSGAQLADMMTKNTVKSREAFDLFLNRGDWKIVYDSEYVSEKNRKKKGLETLEGTDEFDAWAIAPPDEFAEEEEGIVLDPRAAPLAHK